MNIQRLVNVVEFETGNYGVELLSAYHKNDSINKYSAIVVYKFNGENMVAVFTKEEFYNMTKLNIEKEGSVFFN